MIDAHSTAAATAMPWKTLAALRRLATVQQHATHAGSGVNAECDDREEAIGNESGAPRIGQQAIGGQPLPIGVRVPQHARPQDRREVRHSRWSTPWAMINPGNGTTSASRRNTAPMAARTRSGLDTPGPPMPAACGYSGCCLTAAALRVLAQ